MGNKSLMVLLALIGVGILIGFGALIGLNTQEPVVTPTPSPIITTSPPTLSLSPTRTITPPVTTPIPPATNTPAPTVSRVNIYMVAIDDNGKTGTRIGCGDSLIPVTVNIQPTTTPLRAAFEQLVSVKTQFFGQSGLYNALYQSNLRVDRAVIKTELQQSIYQDKQD